MKKSNYIKHFLFFLICLLCICPTCYSQNSESDTVFVEEPEMEEIMKQKSFKNIKLPVSKTIKSNFFDPFWGNIPLSSEWNISFEQQTERNQSLDFTLSGFTRNIFLFTMLTASAPGNNLESLKMRGFGVNFMYKFFLKGGVFDEINELYKLSNKPMNSPLGIYIAPIGRMARGEMFFDGQFGNPTNERLVFTKQDLGLVAGLQFEMFEPFVFDFYTGLGRKRNTIDEYSSGSSNINIDSSDLPFYGGKYKFYFNIRMGVVF